MSDMNKKISAMHAGLNLKSLLFSSYAFWGMILFSAIYCFVMLPIYASVSNNIVYMRTAIPDLVSFFAKVVEVIAISIGYALAVYALYRCDKLAAKTVYLVYGGASLIKCAAAQITLWILDGGIPAFNNGFFEQSLWLIALPWALEMVQFTIFFLIAKKICHRYRSENKSRIWGGVIMPESDEGVYPIGRLNNFKNPLLCGARAGGLVILISKVVLTTIDEIYITIESRPIQNLDEAITCALRYLSDVMCGVMAYFIIVFAMIMICDMAHKAKDSDDGEE